ncbi:MAG: sodium-translocating pyrophosphatase [Lentisphaeria bacterium]
MPKFITPILMALFATLPRSVYAVESEAASTLTPWYWWVAPLSAFLALGFAFLFYRNMMTADEGTQAMCDIAGHVREGAMAYLKRQYSVVTAAFLILLTIFAALALLGIQNPFVPIAFVTGGLFSGICGFFGMKTATNASARTAQAAGESLDRGLRIAFRSGAVMGLVVVGFGLLFVSLWYFILDRFVFTPAAMESGRTLWGMVIVPDNITPLDKLVHMTSMMLTFGMGASTQALFARVGGGIYTKAADVGADLVGKVEAGIPEDDPRNPATIADNVGDNVGDVAGMGADLFESYCGSILATCALGAAVGLQHGDIEVATGYVIAPMAVAGIGILLSIVGVYLVHCKEGASQHNLLMALLVGTGSSSGLILVAAALLAVGQLIPWGVFGAIASGLLAGVIIGQLTEYSTSDEFKPTRRIASQAEMGPATVIIEGLAGGMYSASFPVLVIVLGILCSFGFAGGFSDISMGLYGIGFAAVGMLSTLGITLASDAYGPIADNAGGNAEMSGLSPHVRERTDALDALGNTTAATGKGFAIGSAALTAMALLVSFIEISKTWVAKFAGEAVDGVFLGFEHDTVLSLGIVEFAQAFDIHLLNPQVICGMFMGAMAAFVFCAMTMKAVGRAAGEVVTEVRRQFKEIEGLMESRAEPDYARCVSIVTAAAQREMILPSVLAIIIPVGAGLVLGIAGLVGLLASALATGFVLATTLNNAGGAWDNAKKYIEKGEHGGKNSDAHKASVVGDTVGDPCKDTAGPSLNILIKLMTMVSVVFAPVIVKFSPIIQEWLNIAPK